MAFRGQYNHTRCNKKFVKLHETLSSKYRDGVIANKLSIPTSSFSKIKLGYFYADADILQSMSRLVKSEVRPSILDIKEVKMHGKSVLGESTTVKKSAAKKKSVVVNIPLNFVGDITINVK